MTTITPTAIDRFVAIESIRVVGRHRHELGDIAALAASIEDVDLLNPITLTRDGRLVAGQRRLAACRQLGWAEIPVRFVDNLDDAVRLLHAERDENVCRKDMLPSELASLGEMLYEIESEAARSRQQQAGRDHGRGIASTGQGGSYSGHETSQVVGNALGMSRSTYADLRFAHKAANDAERSDEERLLARRALEEMDRGRGVQPAVNELRGRLRAKRDTAEAKAAAAVAPPPAAHQVRDADAVQERHGRLRELAAEGHTAAQIAGLTGYANATVVRTIAREIGVVIPAEQALGKSQRRIDPNRVVRETVHALEGLAMGVGLILDDLSGLDPAEIGNWTGSLIESTRTLNRLVKQMKEMTQ